MAIGSDGRDLHFSSVRLAPYPAVAGRYSRPNATQGETRSHGFFYDERQGLLGLPIIGGDHRTCATSSRRSSASVLYLRNQSLSFTEIGTLEPSAAQAPTTAAAPRASTGTATRGRSSSAAGCFALMGYELVEGQLDGDGIVETRRDQLLPAWRISSSTGRR